MEISTQKTNSIGVRFIQDFETGVNEIEPFLSSLRKIKAIINKPGLRNEFNKNERELWNAVFDNLIQEKKPDGVERY